MKPNILATAAALSNEALLARLATLAGKEREASVDLVAHLAALDARPSVFAAQGYGSLFSYCTQALRLSEDAACNRIDAARAARRFPVILDFLASGTLTLTSVRLLARHLTPENHQAVLAKASGRSRRELDLMIAEMAPRPDVPSSVRKLPAPVPPPVSPTLSVCAPEGAYAKPVVPVAPPPALVATPRSIVQATAPERYRVQFTIGQETHEKLRRLQDLLRREVPNGDPAVIFDRAVSLLLEKVEKTKLGATANPHQRPSIRRETDNLHIRPLDSRHIPRAVKRAVYRRDGGQCAFVAATGRRCTERRFLEYHHLQPYACQGPATVDNISLRCRRHNVYEAELIFGPYGASIVREVTSRPTPTPHRANESVWGPG